MIISKPKSTALLALGIFMIICFAMGGYALRAILNGVGIWYHYIITTLTLLIALILLIRQVLSYKVVLIGDKSVKISFPLRGKSISYKFNELIHWKETIIETKNAPFKQMELKFNDYILKMSVQESTNYDVIKNYLKKKALKKELR